jgi:hypothetical protein
MDVTGKEKQKAAKINMTEETNSAYSSFPRPIRIDGALTLPGEKYGEPCNFGMVMLLYSAT